MIERIEIKKLHNLYDYDIRIPDHQNVLILTGPNGYGKTTMLKIINNLLTCNFWYFCSIRFLSIRIVFRQSAQSDNSYIIKIERQVEATEKGLSENTSEAIEPFNMGEQLSIELYSNKREFPIETLVLGRTYLVRLFRRYVSSVRDEYSEQDLFKTLEREYTPSQDTYLSANGKTLSLFLQERRCQFIKEQRLILFTMPEKSPYGYRRKEYNDKMQVDAIAEELKRGFIKSQMLFAAKSQDIDATFIKRLVSGDHASYDEMSFKDKLNVLKQKIENYRKYALVSDIDIQEDYPQQHRGVLSLYIDDMENKLAVFEDFYEKLVLFDHFVTGKSLSNKHIILNEKRGISVYNDLNEEIPLASLSSGEQDLVILYYKLVFSTPAHSLLLIDEPENSLHVAWVEQMLNDYQVVADKLKCQIIIATHSPSFINGQWDKTYDLYEHNGMTPKHNIANG